MALTATLGGFFQAAARVASGFRAGAQTALTPEVYRKLAFAIEAIPEFQAVVERALAEISTFAPDAQTTKLGKIGLDLHHGECADKIRALLQRSGYYRDLWNGVPPTTADVEAALIEATKVTECGVTHLIPLDGLYLPEGQVVDFGAGRILSMTKAQWDSFFEAELYTAPDTGELANLGTLEIKTTEPLVPNPLPSPWEAPITTVTKLAGHWIAYVDLWTTDSVRAISLYSKPRTKLSIFPVHQVSISSRTWIPEVIGEDGEEDVRPFFSVSIEDGAELARFMQELEAGRLTARKHGPRVETALRWFLRTADATFGIEQFSLGIPETLYEDVIVDSFTALEAVLLKRKEDQKGRRISERAAGLISPGNADVGTVQQKIRNAYGLRNDIVHGDTLPTTVDLERATRELRVWVRQVLVAALRLGGDQGRIIAGVTDASVRAANRALVPRYPV